MARITIAEARKICTQAELGLLMACRPKAIEKLTADELKAAVMSARRLRDKWRDVATEQRRTTQRQQKGRVTNDNARSAEKAAIFAHAVKKFEGQLKAVEAGGGPTKSAKRPSKEKPTKAERGQSHREVRSITREHLKAAKQEMNVAAGTAKAAPKKKVAKKKATSTAAAAPKKDATKKKSAPAKKKAVKKVAAKPAAKKTAKKKVAKAPKKAGQVSKDAGKQLTATTAAKKSRIKASGLLARVRGHVVARGRRAQGKRDARG
jgi:DNA polymerase III gamma/tau subunit